MNVLDITNKEIRYVMTDRGRGTLIGYDDRDNPKEACVKIPGNGFTCLPVDQCYEVEE